MNTFENFNFLNSSDIMVITNSDKVKFPITTYMKQNFKDNLITSLSTEYFNDILYNVTEKDEVINHASQLINSGIIKIGTKCFKFKTGRTGNFPYRWL